MLSVLKYCGFSGFLTALYYRVLIILHAKNESKRYLKRSIYNYEMYLDVRDPGISRTLLLFARRELEHKAMLSKVLKTGMTVLDIGANIGYYAIMGSKLVGSTGKVIAVEPSPSNIDLLHRNLSLNACENIKVFQGAISDENSEKKFFMANSSNLNTFHNVGSGVHDLTGETITVKTQIVPDIMKDLGKPDLIRMDVEGHEVEVMNGLLPAVEHGEMAPMIIFETHITRYNKTHDMEATLKSFFANGYQVKYLASNAEKGTKRIDAKGYHGSNPIKTDFVTRKIYENITPEDAIELICHTGGARTVLLKKNS